MKNVVLSYGDIRRLSFYLAMEEFVAERIEGEAFFIWQSEPTVIIGRNQDLEAEVNLAYCRENDVKIVRRKSGGGCVYSDEGNIMISYLGLKREDVVIIGDQLFTDIWCGSRAGIRSIFVERLSDDESAFIRFKRAIEIPFVKKINRKGYGKI